VVEFYLSPLISVPQTLRVRDNHTSYLASSDSLMSRMKRREQIPKYVDIVVKLVSQRQRCGRVEELGGEETILRFFALYAVCTQSFDMATERS
jgi:hypothetical protein